MLSHESNQQYKEGGDTKAFRLAELRCISIHRSLAGINNSWRSCQGPRIEGYFSGELVLHDTNDIGGEGYKTAIIDIEWKVYFLGSGCHMVSISGEGGGITRPLSWAS